MTAVVSNTVKYKVLLIQSDSKNFSHKSYTTSALLTKTVTSWNVLVNVFVSNTMWHETFYTRTFLDVSWIMRNTSLLAQMKNVNDNSLIIPRFALVMWIQMSKYKNKMIFIHVSVRKIFRTSRPVILMWISGGEFFHGSMVTLEKNISP